MSSDLWNIVSAAEYGIAFVVLLVFWLVFLTSVRRRNDQLHTPFLWLKWAIPLYLLFLAIEIATEVLFILEIQGSYYSEQAFLDSDYISYIGLFFDGIADAFMLLCLVEVNLCSLRALGNLNFQKGIRYCNFVGVAVLAMLAIASLGESESWVAKNNDYGPVAHTFAAYVILWWITALPIFTMSISVLVIAHRSQRIRWIARRLFAVSILNLVRSTWELYYAVRYLAGNGYKRPVPDVVGVVDAAIYCLFTVAMIGPLIAIGLKWSTVRNQPTETGLGAGVEGGQGHETGQFQQAELIGNYMPIWRPELASISGNPPPYHMHEMDAASALRRPAPHELHNTQIYEAGGG